MTFHKSDKSHPCAWLSAKTRLLLSKDSVKIIMVSNINQELVKHNNNEFIIIVHGIPSIFYLNIDNFLLSLKTKLTN